MTASERLPTDALNALWTITNTALLPQSVNCSYGDPGPNPPPEYAAVGWAPRRIAPQSLAIVGAAGVPAMGNRDRSHQFQIACTISVATGDADRPGVSTIGKKIVNRCADLAELVIHAIRLDQTLGGVVLPPGFADLAGYQWNVGQQGTGMEATVVYVVQVDQGWMP